MHVCVCVCVSVIPHSFHVCVGLLPYSRSDAVMVPFFCNAITTCPALLNESNRRFRLFVLLK